MIDSRYAPLALKAVYNDSVVECQRIGNLQGWDLIFSELTSAPERPAYALFGENVIHKVNEAKARMSKPSFTDPSLRHGVGKSNDSSASRDETFIGSSYDGPRLQTKFRKEIVLAIRGTNSIHDIVTDLRAAAEEFSSPEEDVDSVLAPYSERAIQEYLESWVMISSGGKYACGGMARAARWLYLRVGPSLEKLKDKACDIIITGHSMGGGVAALLTYLLKGKIPNIKCVTYGCPPCMTSVLADELRSFVKSVVLHDDIVSRLTPESIRSLLKDLMIFNVDISKHVASDWKDVMERAVSLWSPRWREVHPLSSNAEYVFVSTNGTEQTTSMTVDLNASMLNRRLLPEDSDSDLELVEEDKFPELWLPGQIMHIYSHCGQYKSMLVDRTFETLRRIEVQGNIFNDHASENIVNALREVIAVREALPSPPWQPFDACDVCNCCKNKFTWHTTLRGKTQEYREMHNCRHCGLLVCGPCSSTKLPIPKYGLIFPSRICDVCVLHGEFSALPSKMT